VELSDYINVLAIVTFANTKNDMERLLNALKSISKKNAGGKEIQNEIFLPELPDYMMSPRQAYFSPNKVIPWSQAKGKIAGEMIAPYPPGIPAIYPGELVTDQVWEYIESYRIRKRHLHGPADPQLNYFKIIDK